MKGDWVRGYGQRYRHLVIRNEITKHFKRTHFACGKCTDYALEGFEDLSRSTKCPNCLVYERNN